MSRRQVASPGGGPNSVLLPASGVARLPIPTHDRQLLRLENVEIGSDCMSARAVMSREVWPKMRSHVLPSVLRLGVAAACMAVAAPLQAEVLRARYTVSIIGLPVRTARLNGGVAPTSYRLR